MIRWARFVGGPKDGDWEPVRDPDLVLQVALPMRPVARAYSELDPTELAPMPRIGLYRQLRRRWNGGLVYEYQGPNAWAVCHGDVELSEPFSTKREAHEWLRAFLKDPESMVWWWPTWPEVRWVPPA